ncbi:MULTISPECIES: methionine adenosyltransferase [Mycolicibacterium]|uniref:S-adenosylmethionine synthase n=1 Tax=Mycolicibacterium senegalense TaxID=1796 RepID=A0A378W8H6_9MYCO|nr:MULTISPECIES: methionine adenosyltransferase [Mycolicibacterium]MCV7336071.1 methionine adenosyltransferase [Mycolicibacterium senegalense]MDR7287923.1 S-adenosylmethionine synthetase [Mycolicibacterium senegalense]QZA24926.1 methionine adenosyltransferase [Mycolicibacterium senegalense]CDP86668.1 S-adenosylmethionine synthetase [Mycolicibacterium farcinogenes]SUA28501.1 methionine adenosyltransferase [Mycolicibacterium senegalense]
MTRSDPHDFLFTSESVTEGHPDKIADAISDAVLDAALTIDPMSRVACETLITTGMVVLAGEITTPGHLDYTQIVRDTVNEIGYDNGTYGFDGHNCAVLVALDKQSPDIAQGVDQAFENRTGSGDTFDHSGAGDQGMMFGYATEETPEYMPMPIALAHRLSRRLATVRKDGTLPYLRPDGKTQVSVRYADGVPVGVERVLISTQHAEEVTAEQIREDLWQHVISTELPADFYDAEQLQADLLINPTGRFVIGGPVGDAGLTGRKIIVDTYGGFARHGGGAFSGKDPSKVDRSAAYAARYVAKNLVAAGLAARAEVQVAYAIGVARPVSVLVDTFGTERVDRRLIEKLVDEHFDLRPAAFRSYLNLNRPIYAPTAAYGHFGRTDIDLPWERTDRAASLRAAADLTIEKALA